MLVNPWIGAHEEDDSDLFSFSSVNYLISQPGKLFSSEQRIFALNFFETVKIRDDEECSAYNKASIYSINSSIFFGGVVKCFIKVDFRALIIYLGREFFQRIMGSKLFVNICGSWLRIRISCNIISPKIMVIPSVLDWHIFIEGFLLN